MQRTFDQHIKGYHPIVSPKELMGQLPLGRGRKTVLDARHEIEQILEGESNKKLLVVGPCSIHDSEAAVEMNSPVFLRDQIKELKHMIAGTKPEAKPVSYRKSKRSRSRG